jgi:tetratricopeptide (TPR) repeat protein
LEKNQQQEIYKNIALIYIQQDKKEEALNFLKVAQRENPNDVNLLLTEANLQYKLGNTYEFIRILERASQKDPNNAELCYNLGVISYESNDFISAKNYYEKTIKLDPNYINAYINMSALILQGETEIINEMNSLGGSKADDKRYNVLKDQRLGLYRSAVPYLEKAIQIDKGNRSAINTLMNIYSILGETREYNRLKKM